MDPTIRCDVRPGERHEDLSCVPCGADRAQRGGEALAGRREPGPGARPVTGEDRLVRALHPWAIAATARLTLDNGFAPGPVAAATATATDGSRAPADGGGGEAVAVPDEPAGETGGDGRAEPPAA